ncbi:MAG TPA: cytidylate kinase-like family protein [Urbifossiella sp.]|nr:cytidylate kinase-like family protein [Urbifossiella sp.]
MAAILPTDEVAEPPLHGFRGDLPGERARQPRGLTIAISREAGARGTTIAHKVGELLGWPVFDQEMLDQLLVNEAGREQLVSELPDGSQAWIDEECEKWNRGRAGKPNAEMRDAIRLVLAVAARGEAVIVGRGAGFFLPIETTLHVRIVAPFDARVHYLSQSMRLARDEAAVEVRTRDERRANYLHRTLLREPGDPTGYDLVANSTRLGVEGTVQLIRSAIRTKQQFAEMAEPPAAAGLDDFAA